MNINNANQIAALLQAQLARGAAKTNKTTATKKEGLPTFDGQEPAPQSAPPNELDAVSKSALSQIGLLPLNDPRSERQAFRIFLREKIARQLRSGSISSHQDDSLEDLVSQVLSVMEQDAELNTAMKEAGHRLLQSAQTRS